MGAESKRKNEENDKEVYSAFVNEKEYGYDKNQQNRSSSKRSPVFRNINNLRDEAAKELEKEIKGKIKFSKGLPRTDLKGSPGTNVRLTHWGRTKDLKELDPAKHGKGLQGAESKKRSRPGPLDRPHILIMA